MGLLFGGFGSGNRRPWLRSRVLDGAPRVVVDMTPKDSENVRALTKGETMAR
jgi:hypothetical protein